MGLEVELSAEEERENKKESEKIMRVNIVKEEDILQSLELAIGFEK